MIVTLLSDLFEREDTDALALFAIIGEGQHRYKVRLRPAYRPQGERPFHRWFVRQPIELQERIHAVLERGLREREYTREVEVEVHSALVDEWPVPPNMSVVRVSLATASKLLVRPLRLLLENGRNDWGFLKKIVAEPWRPRWERAIENGWLEQDVGGGIDELRKFLEMEVAINQPRRIRTWTMFDSDANADGEPSWSAKETKNICDKYGIAYHLLERRAIENYIPRKTLEEWAWRRPKVHREQARTAVREYMELTPEKRYFFNVKEGIHGDLAPEVWGDNSPDGPYASLADGLAGDGFNGERDRIFQSIFAML